MGCDIHLFLEYKAGDGPWTQDKLHKLDESDPEFSRVHELPDVRNYELFSVLAGVRGDGAEPKGLPEDCSDMIKHASDLWDSDGHSHSYTSLSDFKKALKTVGYKLLKKGQKSDLDALWDASYANIVRYAEEQCIRLRLDLESEKMILGQDINTTVQCRFVYFFDN